MNDREGYNVAQQADDIAGWLAINQIMISPLNLAQITLWLAGCLRRFEFTPESNTIKRIIFEGPGVIVVDHAEENDEDLASELMDVFGGRKHLPQA